MKKRSILSHSPNNSKRPIKKPFLIKLLGVHTDKEKRTALVTAIVIDKLHQQFIIGISTRKDKTTIKLFPGTDPEKTNRVKMSLGLTAKIIQEIISFGMIGNHYQFYQREILLMKIWD